MFNDLYHLAAERGIRLTEVRVFATGGFEGEEPTVSTGVTYQVSVSGEASEEQLRELVSEVDMVASIPDVLRRETVVSLSTSRSTQPARLLELGNRTTGDNPPALRRRFHRGVRPPSYTGPLGTTLLGHHG